MTFKNKNKRSIGFLLILVGTFLVLLNLHTFGGSTLKVVNEVYEAPEDNSLYVEEHSHKQKKEKTLTKVDQVKKVSNHREPASLKESNIKFQEKAKEILSFTENYPENKDKLIEVVSSKDVFKDNEQEPVPHSVNDILQQKEGALRVLALRLLMENESKDTFKEDLGKIIREAKDPTMSKIAQEVLKSVEKGRPFFEDFPNAIENL